MQIWYENVTGYLQLELLGDDGKPVSGQTITYSVRLASSGVEQFTGTLVYANNVYSKAITLTTKGEYYVTYTTPVGYEDSFDVISVKDYDDYKADVTDLALEATSQSIKSSTDDISTLALEATAQSIKSSTDDIATLSSDIAAVQSDVTTIASDVDTIKEIETGKWKIISNQLILYRSDNATEITRFNLYDADGVATMTAVAERRVV